MLINYKDITIKIEKKDIRHAYMRVKSDGSVLMTVNRKLALVKIEDIIENSYAKILPKIAQIKEQIQIRQDEKNTAYYLGNKYKISVLYNQDKKDIVILNNQIIIKVTDDTNYSIDIITNMLNNWYKKEALKVFQSRFQYWLNKIKDWNVLDPSLTIRSMKSRFGSYAKHKHKVTLSLWLIKAPLALLDYVIAHELCHIKHFNHGRNFYNELTSIYPNWKERKHELNSIARIYCNESSFI